MTIYISGPISNPDPELLERNIRAFTVAEKVLEKRGHRVCNPTDHCKPSWTWEKCMRVDLAHLLTCDSIYLLDGWEHSRGARIEHDLAVALSMPVYHAGAMP